jgi:hypothetical protein
MNKLLTAVAAASLLLCGAALQAQTLDKIKKEVLHRFHCEFSFTPAESTFSN